ncbi:hypothetical protein D9M68_630170 [compost metagenome]
MGRGSRRNEGSSLFEPDIGRRQACVSGFPDGMAQRAVDRDAPVRGKPHITQLDRTTLGGQSEVGKTTLGKRFGTRHQQ